jgi:nicotinamidase/pyrazinamidase
LTDYDRRTALIIVDMQNDFADPLGSLYVRGGDSILPLINSEIDKAQEAGALVVYSQDWHPPATPHFQKDGGIWPVHCVGESWGSEFYPALSVVEGAESIKKGTGGEDGYSVFSVRDPQTGARVATRLESLLRAKNIARLVIAGLATDYCVKDTVLDARRLGFPVDVLKEGIRAVDLQPGDGERAIEAMCGVGARIL